MKKKYKKLEIDCKLLFEDQSNNYLELKEYIKNSLYNIHKFKAIIFSKIDTINEIETFK